MHSAQTIGFCAERNPSPLWTNEIDSSSLKSIEENLLSLMRSTLCTRRLTFTYYFLPLNSNSDECENAATDREDGDVAADLAVGVSEGPLAHDHVVGVEGHVQGGNHGVRNAQVHCRQKKVTMTGHFAHQKLGIFLMQFGDLVIRHSLLNMCIRREGTVGPCSGPKTKARRK